MEKYYHTVNRKYFIVRIQRAPTLTGKVRQAEDELGNTFFGELIFLQRVNI